MADLPTKQEMLNRISVHLERRKDSEIVTLLWKGYLAALMEWGFFEPHEYHEMNEQLDEIGNEELREIFLGFPDEDNPGVNAGKG